MPYIVLARRWRPQLFKDVVGQEHVTKTLQNAISTGRIAHAYLFSGPRGVGKTTVARILAKAVNCMKGISPEPCEECNTCREITAGRSIDVIEIDAASNRGIDEIRELRESVKFAPVSGRYKVYIIDEAHMLTIEAFNALLKTLEEPPEHVIFILATTEPYKIPATILSRCQRFDFRRLNRSEIVGRLREMAKSDSFSIDDDSLFLIAESADGSMRDALSILDQLLSFSDGNIKVEEVGKILGMGQYHLLDQLVWNIIKNNSSESLNTLNNLADHGADLNQCLKKLIYYFRDLMVYKINPGLIDASEARLQQLARQSEGLSTDRIMRIARVLMQTENDIKQWGYERLNLEMALGRLSRLSEGDIPLTEVLGKLEQIESRLVAGTTISASVAAETGTIYEASAVAEVTSKATENADQSVEYKETDPIHATWTELLKAVKQNHHISLHAILKDALPLSISEDNMVIDFKSSWHREQVEDTENRKTIEAELSRIIGRPMKLKIMTSDSSGGKESASRMEIQRSVKEDESVKIVLDVFEGRIFDIKQ